jgi:hypothetical protein
MHRFARLVRYHAPYVHTHTHTHIQPYHNAALFPLPTRSPTPQIPRVPYHGTTNTTRTEPAMLRISVHLLKARFPPLSTTIAPPSCRGPHDPRQRLGGPNISATCQSSSPTCFANSLHILYAHSHFVREPRNLRNNSRTPVCT